MTKNTEIKYYGRSTNRRTGEILSIGNPENMTLCHETIFQTFELSSRQCRNRRGFGENGAYCKTHA